MVLRSLQTLSLLLLFALQLTAARSIGYARRQHDGMPDAANELIDKLDEDPRLSSLAELLRDQKDVMSQVTASPGPKTLLAPTDSALADFMDTAAGQSKKLLPATLLFHFLNGTFDFDKLETAPMNTVGHSLLTWKKYSKVPGGNGQAVVISNKPGKGKHSKPDITIEQGINSFSVATKEEATSVGDFTIQPVNGVMKLPENATQTIGDIQMGTWLDFLYKTAQSVNRDMGGTLFVPTPDSINAFLASRPGLNASQTIAHNICLNHILERRTAYSVLVRDQGSMITMGGQDLVYDVNANTVSVGNSNTAKVVQFDIPHRNGVIHLIDAVLFNPDVDQVRGNRAAESAGKAANSFVSGPITATNCPSTQGKTVPPSQPNTKAPAQNSTMDTYDATGTDDFPGAILGRLGINSQPVAGRPAESAAPKGAYDVSPGAPPRPYVTDSGAGSNRIPARGIATILSAAVVTLVLL